MNRRTLSALAVAALAALTWSCEDSNPTFPGPPVGVPSPSPTPQPSPSATPEPAPSNRPPTVSVTSGGGCHPSPGRPCTVAFNATASDPDGDTIAYGWDGCAQGNGPLTTCTITAPGTVTAMVLVADGQGGFARATASAEGRNQPPQIHIPGGVPNPAPSNTLYNLVGGQPFDPDDDEDPNVLCQRVTLTASGPCRAGVAVCGGVGDAFDVDVRTLQGPGTCVIEARTTDSWGAAGVHRLVFQVLP